ncbi:MULTISPECIES: hypothetical protein [Leptospira]|jgi:hypothetical protein|uniref:Uncharacterized protein n=2 Tax=Leptospira TaxID=171 RepID=B0SQ99_LEPBP|nr:MULTISPECIES: hypothetical protein [Leptospira]ABZ99251.1 Hypothetical protein LEPBI_I3186 [Leptospira biflexa serovar Patoc strain 'Patoc 1 (Paris)']EMY68333.1 hypothetical protein LEP1GSC199_2998 [Leptospira vanthielii serovar Holland str. Waz Holland = ATCC 700522]
MKKPAGFAGLHNLTSIVSKEESNLSYFLDFFFAAFFLAAFFFAAFFLATIVIVLIF